MSLQVNLRRTDLRLGAAFELAQGLLAVIGDENAGKTLLLDSLAGLTRSEGSVLLGGEAWQDNGRFLPPHRRPVGYVFTDDRLLPRLSVRENLLYGHTRRGGREQDAELDAVIAMFELEELLDRHPHQLDAGERRRAGLGRALASRPRLLLLDDPGQGVAAHELRRYLKRLYEAVKVPIVMTSRRLDDVVLFADRLLVLQEGRTVAAGTPDSLLLPFDGPFALRRDACVRIEGVIAGHDKANGLSHLDFRGGRLHIPKLPLTTGKSARAVIPAAAVSLCTVRPADSSLFNVIPAIINELRDDGPLAVTARLDANGCPLLARVSRKAVELLRLRPGSHVFAQIDSAALLS